MIDLLVEGIGSLRFGCTVAFLLPAIGPVLAARKWAWIPAFGFIAVAGTVGWARFAGWWPDAAGTFTLAIASFLSLVALALAVRGAGVGLHPNGSVRADAGSGPSGVGWLVVATIIASVLAGWLWVPCVGEHFSEPLNNASSAPVRSLIQTLVYVVGIAVPLMVLATLPVAVPRLAAMRDHRALIGSGLLLSAVVGVAIVTGLYSELVVRFTPNAG